MKSLLLIGVIVLGIGCIDRIDFDEPSQIGVLVVDAELSTLRDSSHVKLLRTDILGKRVFPPESGATIVLREATGAQAIYQEVLPGHYRLSKTALSVAVGKTYTLEITLANGQTYRSKPETIIKSPPLESVTWSTSFEQLLDSDDRPRKGFVFDLMVSGNLINDPNETLLQWNIEHVYKVTEAICSPLRAATVCYIRPPQNSRELGLLDGSKLRSGAKYNERILRMPITLAFSETASFLISQRALTARAFQYWEDVNNTVFEVGSVFDAQPAPIQSNIYNINDASERVLGLFSAFDEVQQVMLLGPGDLGTVVPNALCGAGAPATSDQPSECCRCQLLPNSSLNRPDYWP